jgi:hypothetical protein
MYRPIAGESKELATQPDAEPHHIGRVRHHDLGRKVFTKPVIFIGCVEASHRVLKIRFNRFKKFVSGHLYPPRNNIGAFRPWSLFSKQQDKTSMQGMSDTFHKNNKL